MTATILSEVENILKQCTSEDLLLGVVKIGFERLTKTDKHTVIYDAINKDVELEKDIVNFIERKNISE